MASPQSAPVKLWSILLFAAAAFASGAESPREPITLHMIGDSTMADKPVIPPNPERGWGQLLPLYFDSGVRVRNHAVNGRSTKSFIAEKRWKSVLENLREDDFVVIQFGHNDEKTNNAAVGTDPHGAFKANLERFIRETREHKAEPILATPIARRRFDSEGRFFDTHGEYPDVVRQVAVEQNAPLLELHTRTVELLKQLGPDLSLKLFNHVAPGEFANHPRELKDDTHLNAFGATRVCDLAVAEIAAKVPTLAGRLKR